MVIIQALAQLHYGPGRILTRFHSSWAMFNPVKSNHVSQWYGCSVSINRVGHAGEIFKPHAPICAYKTQVRTQRTDLKSGQARPFCNITDVHSIVLNMSGRDWAFVYAQE